MRLDFLWDGRAQPTRGPKPALSLKHIADAGIAIADAEGLGAVTMQRVADDLGFTKMSLYRYVAGKAELVALMVERAIGEPPDISTTGWRVGLKEWAHHLLAAYLRHTWTLEALLGPRPVGPNELGWMERAVSILTATNLTGSERLDAIAVLAGHARSIAQQSMVGRQPEEDIAAMIGEQLRRHGDRFPALVATMATAATDGGHDQAFEFGLERILDGLDILITQRAR
ncbi:TetR/AcrR family transcriptional regulator [Dactylosporangium fulvum]|uniref:TetR/AcrR family transcriptional regulator n=1 Tax=Dactylosporangium fulvum TaxID=53359 RepID=A0ABY5VYH9_9ACTN|nr:TetR/AcrR family transcriptional regulator [Dactylosporangium fulvum]UWP82099.1 TetR/AcrR family transcriptional regulator [Dactylosporangium fulvum]